jgi:hypothetical protein
MPTIELPSSTCQSSADNGPRHPHQEVAELLAAALLRLRASGTDFDNSIQSEVCLDYSANQRVNANPSNKEGVRN